MRPDLSERLPFGIALPQEEPRELREASLRPPDEGPRTIEVGIPVRDGVELAADVYLPPADKLPAPAIVIGTPYDKSFETEGRAYRDLGDYVVVVYDVRGRGKSEGLWRPRVGAAEDGVDAVEWIAGQEWCTGEIGLSGFSFSGFVAWATALQKPDCLRAMVTTSAVGRMMEEIPYTNGCFWLYYIRWWASCRRRIVDRDRDISALLSTLPVGAAGAELDVAGPGWQDYMEHDHLDEYWQNQRWDGQYDLDVPALHVSGWFDREDLVGTFYHYEQMLATSPARERQWLLIGPWSHLSARHPSSEYAGVSYPDAAIEIDEIHVRFFDRFLRGEQNGVDDEPRVRLYDVGARGWRTRPLWGDGTEEQRLYLTAEGQLSDEAGPRGTDVYRYDPLEPSGVRFKTDVSWEPPLDLADLEGQEGVLVWTSRALTDAVILRGQPELELFAATDGDDTDWHVKLADVDTDGRSRQVAWGCLRASHRDITDPQPIVPGEVTRYLIWLTQAFHTFEADHRIRVVLASADYPWFARSLNRFGPIADQADPRTATNTIHRGGAQPSGIRLPVEPTVQT